MPQNDLIQSVSRSLRLLDTLADAPEGLTLQQAAEAAGIKPTTAHNLLRTLAAHAYVERQAGPPRYGLGPAARRLSDRVEANDMMRRVERAVLRLAEELPQTRVSFAQAVDGDVMATLRTTPERPGRVERSSAQPMSPYGSASALVFQAFWDAERRLAYRRRYSFAEYGAHLWEDQGRLDAFIEEVRQLGCATPLGHRDDGWRAAAPVFDPRGRLIGALGGYVAADQVPRVGFTCRQLTETVATLAAQLSQTADARVAVEA